MYSIYVCNDVEHIPCDSQHFVADDEDLSNLLKLMLNNQKTLIVTPLYKEDVNEK
jgi:hypothetical protein